MLLIHAGHPTAPDAAQHEEGAGQIQVDVRKWLIRPL